MFGPAAAQTAVLGFFFFAHGVSWKFFVVVVSCGNLSLCNLRTCHQPFRFHPHLTAPVHGVYRTCPASEGEGQRRNDATCSTGSLPCPGLSALTPRSLLSRKRGTGGAVAVGTSILGHRVGMRPTLLSSVKPSDCHRHLS